MARKLPPGVRRLPSGRYQARPTIDGRQVAIGSYGTAREARAAVEEAHVQARNGAFIDPSSGKVTVDSWANAWIEGRIGIADGTARGYRQTIGQLGWLGEVELADLEPAHVRQRIAEWVAARRAPNTIELYVVHLRAILSAAVDDQRLNRNPAKHKSIELPRGGNLKPRRYLTFAEVEAVTARMAEPYADLTWLLAWTGFRIQEALGLTGSDVDLAAGHFTLRQQWDAARKRHTPLKGQDEIGEGVRYTPVAPDLTAIVERRSGPGFMFPSPRNPAVPLHSTSHRDAIAKACKEAKVESFSAHDLRHTCASWLYATGVSIVEASQWLGHADPTITAKVYTHLWPAQLEQAAAKLAGIRDVDLGGGLRSIG